MTARAAASLASLMFTILDRYILRAIFGSVAMVLVVLVTLGGLFLFLSQQDDIGTGSFDTADALWFVLLNLPQQVWEFLPIAGLIGTLTGLGMLARSPSEITVMRALRAWSAWRVAAAAALGGVLLAVIGSAVGGLLAPPLTQVAKQQKAFAKFANVSFAGRGGAWLRDGDLIVNVEQQSADNEFGGMVLYRLAPGQQLVSVGRAASARTDAAGRWQLSQYAETRFDGPRVATSRSATRALESNISAEFLGLSVNDPSQLDTLALQRLIGHLQANDLDARGPVFAFWNRIARAFAVVFGVLLAVPFVFGSLRAAGAGARTMVGLLLGIAFFALQNMLENGVVVFDVNPVLLAWVPAGLEGCVRRADRARVR
ncbi:MAG: LPS export ABC transporter permease LptG [Steroidobacteraceae bacterium]